MINQPESKPAQVILFVEGDTDEVLFKALIDYYKTVSKTELRSCRICNLRGVTRYSSKLLAKLKNEYIPDVKSKGCIIRTICCSYDTDVFEARSPQIINWATLRKAVKLVAAIDKSIIRKKNECALKPLENALNADI